MSTTHFYHPARQFQRALHADLQLYGVDLLWGALYPLVGFYLFRPVGLSQVYDVTWPFFMSAAYLVYVTQRMCGPESKHVSAAYYFNLPQDRLTAFYAHVTSLVITAGWLLTWTGIGCWLKLGGAGFTACYRIHPEFVALPLLATALTLHHVYCIHRWAFWGKSLAGFVLLATWLIWKIHAFPEAESYDHYWPQRNMSLTTESCCALILAALSVWIIMQTQHQWRIRQIGGIQ